MGVETVTKCDTCEGCGQVVINDDDRDITPWSAWLNVPLRSSGAVLLGLVRPVPCPQCGGKGEV